MIRHLKAPLQYTALFLAGLLLLHFWQSNFYTGPNPAPVLFGKSLVTSFAVVLMGVAPLALALHYLARAGVERKSLVLYAVSAVVSLYYIHISSNTAYTNDWSDHNAYADFISRNWLSPYQYRGRENWFPPFFYYVPAFSNWLTREMGTIQTLTGFRYVCWMFFLVFTAYGLLTLRLARLRGMMYYSATTLFLFWPGNIHLASKINNETAYYAFYAAGFYYAARWYQLGVYRPLLLGILLAGIAFLVRSNAMMLFVIIGWLMLVALRRGWFRPREVWGATGAGICSAAAALYITYDSLRRHNYTFRQMDEGGGAAVFPASHYLFFDSYHYVTSPFTDFFTRPAQQSFWEYLLKTSMYGGYEWPWPHMAMVLNATALLIVLYALLPWLIAKRAEWRGMMPFAAGLVIPIAVLIFYATQRNFNSSREARYIYPALICFAVFFGRANSLYKARNMKALALLGPLLAFSFALLSVVYFWGARR